jgi:hypothetical protein
LGEFFALWGKETWTFLKKKCKFEPNAIFLDNFAKLTNHKLEKENTCSQPPWTQFVLLDF